MKKLKKPKSTSPQDASEKGYSIFEKYWLFVSSLHEEKLKKPTRRELFFRYLSKLGIILVGSFFTTLTFYFLIDPNGIYNSGLNGLLQAVAKLIVGHSNKVGWSSYYLLYYGLGLVFNLLFIFVLRLFFKAKLEIISTSIFYALSQIAWTQLFSVFNLREYIFSRFNPSSWRGLSAQSQLSFTLPYYIVIAIVGAVIYTYGTSLIYQAQATKGGFDIFITHFSSQKKKFSLSAFMQIFGGIILFLITLVNFFWIEDSPKMKASGLTKEIQENKQLVTYPKVKDKKIEEIIKGWKEDMEQANLLEKENKIQASFALRNEPVNQLLTSLFRNKIEEPQLEKYPQEIDYYLVKDEEKSSLMQVELNKLNNSTSTLSSEEHQRKVNLEKRKAKVSKEQERNWLGRYLIYTTNNERLWATIVYIFLTSFLISQIFPRDKIIVLNVYSENQAKIEQGLNLLKKFPTYYYTIYKKDKLEEKNIYVLESYLSKWDYYLLIPYLKQVGKIYTRETNQKY